MIGVTIQPLEEICTDTFLYQYFSFTFSVVKEEIVDDDAPLPCFNGRVVSCVRDHFLLYFMHCGFSGSLNSILTMF